MRSILVLFCFCMVVAEPTFGKSITIDNSSIDFGQAPGKTLLTFESRINNPSKEILHILLRPTCDCVSTDPKQVDIPPGNYTKIKIMLDTNGYSGPIKKHIYIQSNDQAITPLRIDISGTVVKSLPVIPITIFDSPGCLFCMKLKKDIIPSYSAKYGVRIELEEYDINEPRNYEKLMYLEKKHGSPINQIPVAFVGEDVIGGKEEILKRLPLLIQKYKDKKGALKISSGTDNKSGEKALKRIRLLPLISAGLIDSINPCAFASIIFFISYLSLVLKRNRFEVFLAGMLFIAGVFLTYFAVGIGFLRATERMNLTFISSKIMYSALALLMLFLAYRHLYEAILIKRHGLIGNEEVKMKLPDFVRERISRIIVYCSSTARLLPLIFIAAVLVTLLELFCTGQIYFPTILYLVSLKEYHAQGIAYLLFYCFLFVLPLVVIFLGFYSGWTTERIKRYFQGRVYLLKAVMAVFFFMMAVFMLATVFI